MKTQYRFILTELLMLTAQHCRHFISNACTAASQNTPPEGCEVAKIDLCSEDVKTAAVPPCEVPLTGNGCASVCDNRKTNQHPRHDRRNYSLRSGGGLRHLFHPCPENRGYQVHLPVRHTFGRDNGGRGIDGCLYPPPNAT